MAKKTTKATVTNPRKSRSKLWTILVHAKFHFDELVAIVLLMLYGEKLFPNISKARIQIVTDPNSPKLKSFEQELNDRRIPVGVGGGWFDEHGLPRVTCAAELVADKLGIKNHAIRRLIDQVVRCDNDSGVDELHIASIMKRLHRRHSDNPEVVLARCFEIVRDLIEEELAYEEAFQNLKFARFGFNLRDSGRRIRVAVTRSDNPYAATVCRNKGAQIVVMVQPKGNVQVITSEAADVEMSGVARLIRMAELAARGKNFKYPRAYLTASGKVKECLWWYFFSKRGQFLLNGSNQSSPGVEPTVLEPRQILRALEVGACEREQYREPRRIGRLKDRIAERSQPGPEEALNGGVS